MGRAAQHLKDHAAHRFHDIFSQETLYRSTVRGIASYSPYKI